MELHELLDKEVIHKIFGEGKIQNFDGKYLEVVFNKDNKISRFVYPSCFYGFLIMKEKEIQSKIDVIVDIWKKENGIEEKEELQKQYEKTIHEIKERRRIADEKRLRATQKSVGIIRMRNS